MPDAAPVLDVRDLRVHFPVASGLLRRRTGAVRAVDGVSFEVRAGETLGLVGESGCGKSTTGRAVLRLLDVTGGSIRLEGTEIARMGEGALRRLRPRMLAGNIERDLSVEVLGLRSPVPFLLAPIGVLSIAHSDAELGVARAARATGVPMVLSSAASNSLEDVAAELGDSPCW